MARLLLLQCELEHRHQAPHLAMCLFASDLRRAGHSVRCVLVHPTAGARLTADVDLVILDSIFPFRLIRMVQERVDAPVLVGGHNALQHMLRGSAEYALVGPARTTLVGAVEAILNGDPPRVPGGWWVGPEGLECGPPAPDSSPEAEALPYTPDFDWEYFGPPRAPGSNLRVPSVVAALGCLYNEPLDGARPNGFFSGVRPRVPDVRMTPRAALEIRRAFIDRTGGCTFCVFRYIQHSAARSRTFESRVRPQLEVLAALGARGFSLQTENPIPRLQQLLPIADELRFEEIHIRTLPRLVLAHEAALRAAAAGADAAGIQLVLGQVGFEAFDERGLEVFHKGISAADNRAAARLLTEITDAHPHFEGTRGHGFIALHPWTRPEDLRANLDACRTDAPWLLPDLDPRRRLELYNEWSPIAWKAEDDGLLVEAPDRFGWAFRFADDATSEIVAVATELLRSGGVPHEVLGDVLGAWEQHRDPAARKAAYLAVREGIRTAPARGGGG